MSSSHRKTRDGFECFDCALCVAICSVTNLMCAQQSERPLCSGERTKVCVHPLLAFFLREEV